MDKLAFENKLKTLTEDLDHTGIVELVSSLSKNEFEQYKTTIADSIYEIYSIWFSYWFCDKLSGTPEENLEHLLKLLQEAEKIDDTRNYDVDRGACYTNITFLDISLEAKLHYNQKAIEQYEVVLKNKEEARIYSDLAMLHLNRMMLKEKFEDEQFNKILQLHKIAFSNYSEQVLSSIIHNCFLILKFPFDDKMRWHKIFINQFNEAASYFAKKEPIVFLDWFEELSRTLKTTYFEIPIDYENELKTFTVKLLNPLINFETQNPETYNRLGQAFEKAAENLNEFETEQLTHYEIALNYYVKSQSYNQAAWTFPVYATNVIKKMAILYKAQQHHEKVIELYEYGKQIFAKNTSPDFTLNLYWGAFLIEYAKTVYNFNAPVILKEAEEKLLLAKEEGNNYYSLPFLGLAKIALKMGDKEKCFSILKEAELLFATGISGYVKNDEDFKEIWQTLL